MPQTYIHSKEIQTLRSLKVETLDHVKKVAGSNLQSWPSTCLSPLCLDEYSWKKKKKKKKKNICIQERSLPLSLKPLSTG